MGLGPKRKPERQVFSAKSVSRAPQRNSNRCPTSTGSARASPTSRLGSGRRGTTTTIRTLKAPQNGRIVKLQARNGERHPARGPHAVRILFPTPTAEVPDRRSERSGDQGLAGRIAQDRHSDPHVALRGLTHRTWDTPVQARGGLLPAPSHAPRRLTAAMMRALAPEPVFHAQEALAPGLVAAQTSVLGGDLQFRGQFERPESWAKLP